MRKLLRRAGRRVRALFHPGVLDAELDEEIRLHVELETEDLMRTRGLSRDDARRQAMVGFGGVERYREAQRDARGVRWMEQIAQDLKYAARSLRMSPGFVVTSVLTIALGIGVTTTVYSVVNRLILHPLPFANEDRVVLLAWQYRGQELSSWITSDQVVNWQRHADSFETISMLDPYVGGRVIVGHRAIVAPGTAVSPGLFRALGVKPLLGRGFVSADTAAGAPRVLLLGEALWRGEFGGRPDVIGRRLSLNDTAYTVVGVMPEQLIALRDYQPIRVWLPVSSATLVHFGATMQGIQGVGILKPGVSRDRAQQELSVLLNQLMASRGPTRKADEPAVRLVKPTAFLSGMFETGLWALFGSTLLVLLIACANVANLQLIRAARRAEEIAVRTALGASRGRLVRQLLVESSVLSGLGGIGGILVGWWGLRAITTWHPAVVRQLNTVGLDRRVLAFGIVLIVVTTLISGLVPAWHTTSWRLAEALRGVPKLGRMRGRRRLQSAVVIAEIGLAFLLLVCAGLPMRSLLNMLAVDPGYEAAGLLEVGVWLPQARYPDSTRQSAYWQAIITRVGALPGVVSVVTATSGMLQANHASTGGNVQAEDGPLAGKPVWLTIEQRRVPADYFRTLGIRMLAGRTFSPTDERGNANVEVINRSLAQRLWPGVSAIGKRFRWGEPPYAGPWITVVGVVNDVGVAGLPGAITLQEYKPHGASDIGQASGLFVRVRRGTSEVGVLSSIKDILRSLDPQVPITSATTESALLSAALGIPRFSTVLLTTLAGLALLLAAVGLYGVIAYAVTQRTHELGIRIALGARTGDVSRLVVGDGVRLALVGSVIGLAAALASVRLLTGLLVDVSPTDPVVFIAIPCGVLSTALLASYLPARRAARVDPVIALRAE